jgi:hypothetical protein
MGLPTLFLLFSVKWKSKYCLKSMQEDKLQETKSRLASTMLGRSGVHGFGLNRKRQVIKIYLTADSSLEQSRVIAAIEREAHPFLVEVENTVPAVASCPPNSR